MKTFEQIRRAAMLGLLCVTFLSSPARADLFSDCEGEDDQLAIKACSELIRRNPNSAVSYYNRGVALNAVRKFEEALEDYNRAIKINPRHPSFYHNRGINYDDLENLERAIEDYSTAIKLDQNSRGTYRARAWARVRANKDLKEALADCVRVIKENPKEEFGYNLRSTVYYRLGQMKEAIADADTALKFDSALPDALFIRGLAKLASGDQEGGKKDMDEAVKIDSNVRDYFAKYGIK